MLPTRTSSLTRSRQFASPLQGHGQQRRLLSDDEGTREQREREEQRKVLMGQLRQTINDSFVVRFKAVMDAKDMKLFRTSEALLPAAEAASMPPLQFESLAGPVLDVPRRDRHTLLLLSFNQLGLDNVKSWREPVERHLQASISGTRKGKARLQVVQLNVGESGLFKLLARPLRAAFARGIPEQRRDAVGTWYKDFAPWREALGVTNNLIGYAFLIDKAGRIRWRACSNCVSFEESMHLIDSLSDLLKED